MGTIGVPTLTTNAKSDGGLKVVIEPKIIQQDPSEQPSEENKPMKITYKIERDGYYNVVFSNE